MNDVEKLANAENFMILKHTGQFRKTGEPYYVHPLSVSYILKRYGFDIDYQIAGLFHDLLEDTSATEEEIIRYGSKEIAVTVKLLTKYKGYIMLEYINNISQHIMAKNTKLADRLDNLDPKTFKTLDWKFRNKYIIETEEYYEKLYEDSVFQEEYVKIMRQIKNK